MEEDIPRRDIGGDGEVDEIAEKAERAVAQLGRPLERNPVQFCQYPVETHIRVDFRPLRQWRLDLGADTGYPEIRVDEHLPSWSCACLLRARRQHTDADQSDDDCSLHQQRHNPVRGLAENTEAHSHFLLQCISESPGRAGALTGRRSARRGHSHT